MSEPEPKQTKRRQGAWKRWTRTVHIYASLLGLLLLLFFGSTGFVLNHEEWFALARASEQGQATLPAELLSEPEPLALVEAVRARFDVRGALVVYEPEGHELRLRFERPGEESDVTLDLRSGAAQLYRQRGGLLAVLTDFHTGKTSGGVGGLMIDAAAVLLVLISLSGLVLWFTLPKRRAMGALSLLVALGVLAIAGAYVLA
ncbi:MAG TPA: peptidase [Planctomycetes bacterium]|nr:peptidase [Planctomycetota bacterium]